VFPGAATPLAGPAADRPSPYQSQAWQPAPAITPVAPAVANPIATPIPVAPPIAIKPAAHTVATAPGAVQAPSAAPVTLRVKNDPPAGYAAARREPRPPAPNDTSDYAVRGTTTRPASGRAFPWKAAAAALVVLAAGAAAAREYLPALGKPVASAPATRTNPVPNVPDTLPAGNAAAGTVVLTSEPAGARVLVDGEPAGTTPLTLEGVKPGRRVLTLVSDHGGSVKRTVRVEAGKSITVDVPIFAGFVAIASPIVLQVAENGRLLGTTEQGRVMLAPGRHVITVSNRDLEYTSVHVVEIEPGEDRRLTIEPRAAVSLNALPWAEVWIDGARAGETPLANLQVPLGTREIVFKHPQYGERRMTTTIKATSPASISVDLTRPSNPS
jgi:hypothetical protein